jgi:hypothetical protein
MDDTMTLAEYVDSLDVPDPIDRDWLMTQCLAPLGIDAAGDVAADCEDALIGAVGLTDGTLHMRPGGWQTSLKATLARGALTGAILAGAMAAGGFDEIPKETLVAVIPAVVAVEPVRLSRRDRELLVPIRIASAHLVGQPVWPRGIYDRLDKDLRGQLNYHDFVAFCDHLIAAGEMDDGGYDEIKPRAADAPAWIRLTLS